MLQPALITLYAWFEIITLPFKFFASELFMWNMEQLESLRSMHRFLMIAGMTVSLSLVCISLIAQQEETRDYRERIQALDRVVQVQKDLDRHDRIIEQVRSDQYHMSIQLTKMSEGLLTLNRTLSWVLWAISGIAGILLLPVASYIFNLKMRRELGRISDRKRKENNLNQDDRL